MWLSIFSKQFFFGVLFLLISFVLAYYFPTYANNLGLFLVVSFLSTLGIALLVASIFSYSLELPSFINKIKSIIEKVIIGKDFLSDMSNENKREVLSNIIKPNQKQLDSYSNIESYYNYFIHDIMSVAKKNVRSNYRIFINVYEDKRKKRIYSDGVYSYRLFPSEDGYNPIILGFIISDEDSKLKSIIINSPDGKTKDIEIDKLKPTEVSGTSQYEVDIQEFGNGHGHLDIELRMIEYGHDHWLNVNFKALQPTDGFQLNVYCHDKIRIQENIVFEATDIFNSKITSDKKELNVSCYQWVNEGTGLSCIVSKKQG